MNPNSNETSLALQFLLRETAAWADSKHSTGDDPDTFLMSFSWVLSHYSAITTDLICESTPHLYSLPAQEDRLETGPVSRSKQSYFNHSFLATQTYGLLLFMVVSPKGFGPRQVHS